MTGLLLNIDNSVDREFQTVLCVGCGAPLGNVSDMKDADGIRWLDVHLALLGHNEEQANFKQ